jgi:hypothetical protein
MDMKSQMSRLDHDKLTIVVAEQEEAMIEMAFGFAAAVGVVEMDQLHQY